ncbi:MAG: nickel-dependent lactate racemase [Candidatus Bathyarchaeia archaeon]
MKLTIPYGNVTMPLNLDGRSIREVSPKHVSVMDDVLSKSLVHSRESSSLESFVSERKKLLLVINDHTRPFASGLLGRLPLKCSDVTTIVATGSHREPTPEELRLLFGGDAPPYGGRVVIHNSRDPSCLKTLGSTTRGTDVRLNLNVFNSDGIIVIGSVEPHYYAGFTGGRKFLLPGLAAFESIEMNHSLALDDKAQILRLEGNPVHEDFMDALRMFGRNDDIYSIQLVMNNNHEIEFASSGNILSSFMDAVQQATKKFVCEIDYKADILIAVVNSPLDIDLYQAHKAIENVKLALKDDGVLILVAKCSDGIGNRGFYDILSSKSDILEAVTQKYTFGGHKALRITQLLQRVKIFAVTEIAPTLMETISIRPFSDLQSAMEEAVKLKGSDLNILLVHDAGVAVPVPRT